MTENNSNSPALIVFLLYLLPILAWVFYTFQSAPLPFSWVVTAVGLSVLFLGSALMITLFKTVDIARQPAVIESVAPAPVLNLPPEPAEEPIDETPRYLQEIKDLKSELQNKEELIRKTVSNLESIQNESNDVKEHLKTIHDEFAQKEDEARHKIESLQVETHQKQQAIQQLENQIHDLRYEIKTLLNLTEVNYAALGLEPTEKAEPVPEIEVVVEEELTMNGHVTSEEDARKLLKRCLNIAQKMTGGYRSSSLRTLSADPYAFDLRQLSDSLRLETGALIVVYSPNEERLLFANKETKALLGWGPEKFTQDFTEIAAEGLPLWKSSVAQLLTKSEVNFALGFKTKSEETLPLNVLMGIIPTGIFRSLVVGILYPHS